MGLALALALAGRLIGANGWDPTILTAFGAEAVTITEYAEARIGQITVREAQGHDGKFFFIQAHDPWLLAPTENADLLDRPVYRSQRMLYPLLAGGGGLFPSEVIIWSMIVVNLLALGIGSWATARIAVSLGGSAWWGLAFGLNLGLISELMIGGAGLVGFMFAVLAVLAVLANRLAWAVVGLTGAALSREAMVLVAAGMAFSLWRAGRRGQAVQLAGVPTGVAVLWALYIRWRLGWPTSAEVQEIGPPFQGFIRALTAPDAQFINVIVGILLMFILGRLLWHVARHRTLIGMATIGFVPLAILFTRQVWFAYFDITRAVAPALTGYLLAVFVENVPETGAAPLSRSVAPDP